MRAKGVVLLVAATALAGCSGDLFHSTDWLTLCSSDPTACPDPSSSVAAATSGSSSTSSSTGGAPSTSTGVGSSTGGGGSGATGTATTTTSATTVASSTSLTGTGGAPTCATGEVQEPVTLHCYAVVETPADWASARTVCAALGGDLASITSAAENAFVAAQVTPSAVWLGGTDAAVEGTWTWSNGDAFGYSNWNAGEPNNAGTGEDCNAMYGPATTHPGLWNDADCANAYPYVCERAP